jgi:RimJ/RimL family protein N-acetyltransferase
MVVKLLKVKNSRMYKQAFVVDSELVKQAQSIMDKIYKENPKHWPYGLTVEGHDSVYIIEDNLTKEAAGFIGWQEHYEDGENIGSYSIGILPEFRNKKLAKEAVAKVIQEKSASVDKIVSYIIAGNSPSENLAKSLNIPIIHSF